MKRHKIAGISKHICSREQLFAYHLALNLRKEMNKKLFDLSDADFRNLINDRIDSIYYSVLIANSRGINAEAVYIAMLHGSYIFVKNSFALLNYEQIGIIFYI